MEEQDKYERIEQYLNGELPEDDKQQLEALIAESPDLKSEIELHRQVEETLKGEEIHQFRNVLQATDKSWKLKKEPAKAAKIVRFNFKKSMAIAASIAILIFAGNFLYQNLASPNQEQLFANNFEPYQMILSQRSTGDSPESTALLNTAISQYAQGKFEESSIAFRQLQINDEGNLSFQFYEAMSLLSANNATDAISKFENILATPNSPFLEQTRWYLALSYLKAGNKEKAISLLADIKESEFKFQEKLLLIKALQ